jgi:hypothetical protein
MQSKKAQNRAEIQPTHKMKVTVSTAKVMRGGIVSKHYAVNLTEYIKRHKFVTVFENTDTLCLPRAFVFARELALKALYIDKLKSSKRKLQQMVGEVIRKCSLPLDKHMGIP